MDSFTGKPDQIVKDEYDFPAREEHNAQGRWTSPDPIRGTGNKYVYANNNPLSNIDVYGLLAIVNDGLETDDIDTNSSPISMPVSESYASFAISRQNAPTVQFLCGAIDCSAPGTDNMLQGMGLISPPPTQTASTQQQQQTENSQRQAQNQTQTQTQTQSNQQSNAPANSRTDVLLYSNEYTPKPTKETAWFWETTWKAGTCSGDRCSQSSTNEKETISLVESLNGSDFKPSGVPAKGTAHDQISPEPKTVNQHWFVDGKQVQLVVGKDSNGNLVKTWEVHIEIKNLGDRPVYSPVP